MTRVWPALWPPWKRTTMSACSDNQSTILPFPSSPHWAPTTTTLAIRKNPILRKLQRFEARQSGREVPFLSAIVLSARPPDPAKRAPGGPVTGLQPDKGSERSGQARTGHFHLAKYAQAIDIP